MRQNSGNKTINLRKSLSDSFYGVGVEEEHIDDDIPYEFQL